MSVSDQVQRLVKARQMACELRSLLEEVQTYVWQDEQVEPYWSDWADECGDRAAEMEAVERWLEDKTDWGD